MYYTFSGARLTLISKQHVHYVMIVLLILEHMFIAMSVDHLMIKCIDNYSNNNTALYY